jgi:hypothetical protein
METTFNIADHKERLADPATFAQCKALGWKFGKQPNGKMNYTTASRVTACLLNSNLTFKQANDLFKKKSLPKKYVDSIAAYMEANS